MKNLNCKRFITNLPKAELHVHIEGTMEPSQLRVFAERNKIAVPAGVLDASGQRYLFSDLASFLKAYLQATTVLQTEQDFYDLTFAYLKKVAQQGVLHTEIFFDLQSYLPRKVAPATIINGMHRALVDGKKQLGISGFLIMCFLRNLSEEDAFKALGLLDGFRDKVIGVGLAAVEEGNPPMKFTPVFAKAVALGFRTVAHVGEGSHAVDFFHQAITQLGVERIDHGIACMSDAQLVRELAKKRIPLTVCPLSNVALGLYKKLEDHPLDEMFDAELMVTINSDDPAFFGGYILENYLAVADALDFSCSDLVVCARNSFTASFLSAAEKARCLAELDDYVEQHDCS